MTAEPARTPAERRPKVIALDGPAASGKGTLARCLARHYGFAHLDTGVLYRGVAWIALDRGIDPADALAAARIAADFSLDQIDDAPLRSREVGAAASIVAANADVRRALLEFQRAFAANPPDGASGAVLDGRDIGTVVCPDACVKFYVFASPEERARRRLAELRQSRPDLAFETVLADLQERDARDAARADAPMKPAPDAEHINTTDMSIEAVVAAARLVIDGAFRRCS